MVSNCPHSIYQNFWEKQSKKVRSYHPRTAPGVYINIRRIDYLCHFCQARVCLYFPSKVHIMSEMLQSLAKVEKWNLAFEPVAGGR